MATVLIHLNIEVDDDEPEESARDYLLRHNIPVDDVADIEAI